MGQTNISINHFQDQCFMEPSDQDLAPDECLPQYGDEQEPIAIIGLSLRFAQDATTPEAFWNMMCEGRSGMTEVPKERFNIDAYYHPDVDRLGSLNCRGGHFLNEDIGAFDAPFFSISPTEAACMDPQHRILLETSYRALENAGISIESIAGSDTSVHVGCFCHEYEIMFARDPESQAKYQAVGIGPTMLANRLSWFYDLRGPSISLDTACSSSMTALYLACQNLMTRETNMGIVGGCNLILNPDSVGIPLSNMDFLSPDSRCYSFDERANGYSRGEGFGIIIIKRLRDAIKDGDTIRAVIRGVGSNQDGKTAGISQPNSEAQESLIRSTYRKAGLDWAQTKLFEAHGTGTQVGDSLEARAIANVFREWNTEASPLYVGAVKTNVGHLEGGSGMASIIKTVLALENGIIPPNAGLRHANPNIPFREWNLKLPKECTPWPVDGLRRASINSFGYGGSNAHVILDDAYHYLQSHHLSGKHCTKMRRQISPSLRSKAFTNGVTDLNCQPSPKASPKLFVWSSSDEAGLKRQAASYHRHLSTVIDDASETYLADLAYTLASRRSILPWKSFLVADSVQDLEHKLLEGNLRAVRSTRAPAIGFVFTGQGAQWPTMGQELLIFDVFRKSLQEASRYLQSIGCPWDLIEELQKPPKTSRIHMTDFSQPICTALQIALVDLLDSWGIRPSAVVGHSSGEIAAAYCARALSKHSAWKIAYYRGTLANQVRRDTPGAMMSVGLSEEDAEQYIAAVLKQTHFDDLTVGCVNSSSNVTVTGSDFCVDALKEILNEEGIFARKLDVPVAYHSKHMNSIAREYLKKIGKIELEALDPQSDAPPPMFSSVTGHKIAVNDLRTASYWVQNLVSKVKFADAIANLQPRNDSTESTLQLDCMIEIGPHPSLRRYVNSITDVECLKTLDKNSPSLYPIMELAGQLFSKGCKINFRRVSSACTRSKSLQTLTDLPEYPFNHSQIHWIENRTSRDIRHRKRPRHELLGTQITTQSQLGCRWRNTIRSTDNPWIVDHRPNNSILYPASGLLVMAIEAARQVVGSKRPVRGFRIKDAVFKRALVIQSPDEGVETEFSLIPKDGNASSSSQASDFRLCAFISNAWIEICEGVVVVEFERKRSGFDNGTKTKPTNEEYKEKLALGAQQCYRGIEYIDRLYESAASTSGYHFGPTFQTLSKVSFSNDGQAIATIGLDGWKDKVPKNATIVQPYVIHPTSLDGVFQGSIVALSKGGSQPMPTMIPTQVRDIWFSSALLERSTHETIKVHTKKSFQGFREADFAMIAMNEEDEPLVIIDGYRITAVNDSSSSQQAQRRRLGYGVETKPDLTMLSRDQVPVICEGLAGPLEKVPTELISDWELVCYYFMHETLRIIRDEHIVPPKPYLESYIAWMRSHYDFHCEKSLQSRWSDWSRMLEDSEWREELLNRIESSGPEGRLFVGVGRSLHKILCDNLDPVEFLFRDNLLQDFYACSSLRNNYLKISAYIDLLAHKSSDMSILEVGAGTGAATEFALNAVDPRYLGKPHGTPRYSQYTYTDISSSFLERAKERFHFSEDRMDYKILDIEQDPISQGFEPESYDLIIASQVLHATGTVDLALANARKLLKPGGKIIILESTNLATSRIPFVFGLLPGWWPGAENRRKLSPLLTENEWRDALSSNGFSGEISCLNDRATVDLHSMSLLVAQAPCQRSRFSNLTQTLLLITQDSLVQKEYAQLLHTRMRLEDQDSEIIGLNDLDDIDLVGKSVISLLELDASFFSVVVEGDFKRFQSLIGKAEKLFWVTGGGGQAPSDPSMGVIEGLAATLRSEWSKASISTLALEHVSERDVGVSKILDVYREIHESEIRTEVDYVDINGTLQVKRLVEDDRFNDHVASSVKSPTTERKSFGQQPRRALKLSIASPGLLDTLQFVDDENSDVPIAEDEVEIEVKANGLNFKDIMIATGQLPETRLGQECAGIVRRIGASVDGYQIGDRVCCLGSGAFRTYVRSHFSTVAKIPAAMDYSMAAGLPVVFCTAYYALLHVARLSEGESILIHSAAGGVGQAALQIARSVKAEIFATVGAEDKKSLLVEEYGVSEDHIFSSRDTSFVESIKRMTNRRGVDVILNSTSGEILHESWQCIAPLGRFIEIGKRDIEANAKLSMLPFAKNISFSSIDLNVLATEAKPLMQRIMTSVMELFEQRKLHAPMPLHVFNGSRIEEAFRYLQSGKNTGKTIIEIRDDDVVPTISNPKQAWSFDPEASYVVTGGLGGLGRSIARWMVGRGAKNLILMGRRGATSTNASKMLDELKAQGVTVIAPPCDISDSEAVASVIEICQETMPPIKGCIHGAMALKDKLFDSMDVEDYHLALAPKVCGTLNLHANLPQDLSFFIMLSSTGAIIGNKGQANYASACTFQDAFARSLSARGQKCVSLNLGLMLGIGYAADNKDVTNSLLAAGHEGITEQEFHAMLEYYCKPAQENDDTKAQIITGLPTPASLRAKGSEDLPDWLKRPLFKHLHQIDRFAHTPVSTEHHESAKANRIDYAHQVRTATSDAHAAAIVKQGLVARMAKILFVPETDVDTDRSMTAVGVDSLVAVEIRQWLLNEVKSDVPVFQILASESLGKLAEAAVRAARPAAT